MPTVAAVAGQLPKRPFMRLGSLSQRFFTRGDDEEASGYKDAVVENAAPTSADLHFDSFDKIPRRRRPIFAMAGLMSLLAIGAVTWRIQRGHPRSSPQVVAVQAAAPVHPPAPQAAGSNGPTVPQAVVAVTPVPKSDDRSKRPERAIRPTALHGVVWSAAANQLVPAAPAAVDLAPAVAAIAEPRAEDTSPAHFDPATPATESAPILE